MIGASNFWMILFLLAVGQGFFLAIVLALKTKTVPANRYLSLLLAAFSLSIFYYVAFWTGLTNSISPLWGAVLALPTCYGVLMYAFALRIDSQPLPLWHYLPFVIHFGYMTLYYGQVLDWWQASWLKPEVITSLMVMQNLFLVIYTVLYLRAVYSREKTSSSRLRMLGWFFAGFVVSHLSYYVMVWTINFQPIHDYFISISMCAFMFMLGYWSINDNFLVATKRNGNYKKSGLSTSMLQFYSQRLTQLMITEKPFKDGDLKLADLAMSLDISTHNLSEIINCEFGVNFSEFINRYRIEEARRIMQSHKGQQLKLIDIAYLTGFNNKTSFSQAFKRVTSYTPSEFRSQLQVSHTPLERS